MTDDGQLIRDLGAAMQRYQRSTQAMGDAVGRRFGLGTADLRCLDWLVDGPRTPSQLSRAIGLRPAATTAVIDRLERRGLVVRSRDSDDRRVVTVRMTDEARQQAEGVYRPIVEEETALLQGMTADDLARLRWWFEACTEITERRSGQLSSDADDSGRSGRPE